MQSLKYPSLPQSDVNRLNDLERAVKSADRSDHISIGLIFLEVWERYPDHYDMFLDYCKVRKRDAERLRTLALYYDVLAPEEQVWFRSLNRQLQRFVMSNGTHPEIKAAIFNGEIKNQDDYREAMIKHRIVGRDELLADEISNLLPHQYERLINEMHDYYGDLSKRVFKAAKSGCDTSVYPNRYIDVLIAMHDYRAVKSFYEDFKHRHNL